MAAADAWLSTRATCEMLGETLRALYRLIDEVKLPNYQFGRAYGFSTETGPTVLV